MSERSNGYVFGFAAGVCLVCAILVSGSVVALKDRQEANILLDRQKKVLGVAGIIDESAAPPAEKVGELYKEYIQAHVVTLEKGEMNDSVDAATFDQKAAAADPARSAKAPDNKAKVARIPTNGLVYHVMKKGKVDKLIIPVEGKGLWSTLYGYIALENDANTVAGLTFYSHAETPGLGGEIDNPAWKALWKGRKVYGDDGEPKIEVIKGAAGPASADPYKVDGLSGATITSRGVSYLVQFWMDDSGYGPYINNFRSSKGNANGQ